MSWWFSGKDKAGRRWLWLIDTYPIHLIPVIVFLVGITILLVLRSLAGSAMGSIGIAVLGYLCLAKVWSSVAGHKP